MLGDQSLMMMQKIGRCFSRGRRAWFSLRLPSLPPTHLARRWALGWKKTLVGRLRILPAVEMTKSPCLEQMFQLGQ